MNEQVIAKLNEVSASLGTLITAVKDLRAVLAQMAPAPQEPAEAHTGHLERFDEFWHVYPRKTDKKPCMDIWRRKRLDKHADKIIEAVIAKSMTSQWQKDDGKFIEYPSTFLNRERWKDEISTNGAFDLDDYS